MIIMPELTADGLTLASDLHMGNNNVDEKLLATELAAAVYPLYINGDVADMINLKDKRYDPAVLVPRLRHRKDILTAGLDYTADFLRPYVDNIYGIGLGNHETHSEEHTGYDFIRLLLEKLGLPLSCYMGYNGVIPVSTSQGPRVVSYHHGSGKGSSPRAVIDALTRRQFVPADVYWQGHAHVKLAWKEQRFETFGRKVRTKEVAFVSTGAYMRPYTPVLSDTIREDGRRGSYAEEASLSPGGTGGATVMFTKNNVEVQL